MNSVAYEFYCLSVQLSQRFVTKVIRVPSI